MKQFILAVAALLASATALFADVKDGDTFRLAGRSVTYNVNVLPGFNEAEVSVTDSSGTSTVYTGTPGASGGHTTSQTPTMTTPGGTAYRVKDCTAERKNSAGLWIDLGKPRKNSAGPAPEEEELLDVDEGKPAPPPEPIVEDLQTGPSTASLPSAGPWNPGEPGGGENTPSGGGVLGSEDGDTVPVTEKPAPRP